jgi:hypothetical protein
VRLEAQRNLHLIPDARGKARRIFQPIRGHWHKEISATNPREDSDVCWALSMLAPRLLAESLCFRDFGGLSFEADGVNACLIRNLTGYIHERLFGVASAHDQVAVDDAIFTSAYLAMVTVTYVQWGCFSFNHDMFIRRSPYVLKTRAWYDANAANGGACSR